MQTEGALPAGFVYLADAAPGVRVSLSYCGADNFLTVPVDGYLANRAISTLPAAQALCAVQQALADAGLGLKVFDAYRPQRAVEHFQRWAQEPEDATVAARFHPELSKQALFDEGYIAARSSHTRGSTFDLTVVDGASGEELDMGTEFDFFGPQSAPDYPGLSVAQRANRLLLRLAMERRGFTGFALEWWHFTLRNEPYPNQYFDFPVR